MSPAGELDKLTTTPPDPAGLVKLTVPVAEPPLVMVLGVTPTLARAVVKAMTGGFTVTAKVWFTPR